MDISIVILNYKSKGYTLNCIKSILEADWAGLSREIIVVDNASRDFIGDIVKWQYPDIKFIQNEKNLGMGAGNNAGLREAAGDYLVVMNPDTIAFRDTFKKLHAYMESDKKIGVTGPKQLNPDGSVQDTCFHWPGLFMPMYRRTPVGGLGFARRAVARYLMRDYDRKEAREVDWLMGSFLFGRREAVKQAGYFDERYFMYFEDTDLCRSMRMHGWKVVYYPEAQIIHNHTRQSAQTAWYRFFTNKLARRHIVSWIKYLWKWK